MKKQENKEKMQTQDTGDNGGEDREDQWTILLPFRTEKLFTGPRALCGYLSRFCMSTPMLLIVSDCTLVHC